MGNVIDVLRGSGKGDLRTGLPRGQDLWRHCDIPFSGVATLFAATAQLRLHRDRARPARRPKEAHPGSQRVLFDNEKYSWCASPRSRDGRKAEK